MANGILIMGKPGSGKSTSVEALDPTTTFIINVADKSLPFGGWKRKYTPFNSKDKTGNMASTSKASEILTVMEIVSRDLPHVNTLILDDYNYMSAFDYMNRSEEIGYQKFNIIGKNIYLTATKPKDLREDLIVIYLNHEDESSDESGVYTIKAQTVGKVVDNVLKLEGLFTIVLRATTKKTKEGINYLFETQTDGRTTSKSPKGMFKDREIPNDLELVRTTVLAYNE